MIYLISGIITFAVCWKLWVWFITNANKSFLDRPLIFNGKWFHLLCWVSVLLLFVLSTILLYHFKHVAAFAPLVLFILLFLYTRKKNARNITSLISYIVHEYAKAIKEGKSDIEAKREAMMAVDEYVSDQTDIKRFEHSLDTLIYTFLQLKGLAPEVSITNMKAMDNVKIIINACLINEGLTQEIIENS